MPNFGSTKQNTGGSKIKDGTSDDYDMGQINGFGTDKGGRNKRTLRNDNGAGGGRFKDTDNDKSNDTRTNQGARNKRSLRNDDGMGGGRFVDTDNDKSSDGFGGGMSKPSAGDGY